jgi:hypothetical protein
VRARFVVDEAQRQVEAQAVAAVAVVGNAHGFLSGHVVFGWSTIWEKFPKFANDFQGVAAQDISRV